jgi:peptide/nickel transport system substrate-binding protein
VRPGPPLIASSLLLFLGLGLGLAACQPARPPGSLIVGQASRINSLDPIKASRVGVMQALAALGDPLYSIEADGRIEPRLATALPQLSADGLRARIPLRQDVLFHDGSRFDADALVFSLQRFIKSGTLGFQLADRLEAVRAVGPYEVELSLKRPFAPLPRLLSAIFLTPVSPTAYKNHRDKPLNERFVGTGPYRLTYFSEQQQRLVPFERYWGRRPANGGLTLTTYSNSTSLLGGLRSGEIDLHRSAQRGEFKEGVGPALDIGFLSLLTSQPPLDNPTLRQAIAASLDHELIEQRVSLGMRPSLRSLVPPSLPGADPEAWPAFNPERARSLYKKAGYCNGKRLSLPLTFLSDVPTDRLFALTWQSQLKRDLDDCVRLEVSGMESTTAYSQLDKQAFPMILINWMGDYPDAENYLSPMLGCTKPQGNRCLEGGSALSGSFWTAPGLDAQLQRSSELAGPERLALLRTIQRRAADGVPYLPVWVVRPAAWARPQLEAPRFDGSGRVLLSQLRPIGPAASPAATSPAAPNPNKAGGQR